METNLLALPSKFVSIDAVEETIGVNIDMIGIFAVFIVS